MKIILSFIIGSIVIFKASCHPAKSTGKTNYNNGSFDLSSIDPGQYDATWWNRAPYRLFCFFACGTIGLQGYRGSQFIRKISV